MWPQNIICALILSLQWHRIECPRDILQVIYQAIMSHIEAISAELWFLLSETRGLVFAYRIHCQIDDHRSKCVMYMTRMFPLVERKYTIITNEMTYYVHESSHRITVERISIHKLQAVPQIDCSRYIGARLLFVSQ